MEQSNYYEDRKNRQFLDNTPEKIKSTGKIKSERSEKEETQEEKLKRTVKDVGIDVLTGVLGGGLGAAIAGSYSFVAGLIVSGIGHYTKNKYISGLGLGMMASSSMKMAQGVKQDPNANMLTNMKERVQAFGQELQRKLLLKQAERPSETKTQNNLKGIEKSKEDTSVPPQQAFDMINKQIPNNVNPQKIDEPQANEKKEINNIGNKKLYFDDMGLNDISDRIL